MLPPVSRTITTTVTSQDAPASAQNSALGVDLRQLSNAPRPPQPGAPTGPVAGERWIGSAATDALLAVGNPLLTPLLFHPAPARRTYDLLACDTRYRPAVLDNIELAPGQGSPLPGDSAERFLVRLYGASETFRRLCNAVGDVLVEEGRWQVSLAPATWSALIEAILEAIVPADQDPLLPHRYGARREYAALIGEEWQRACAAFAAERAAAVSEGSEDSTSDTQSIASTGSVFSDDERGTEARQVVTQLQALLRGIERPADLPGLFADLGTTLYANPLGNYCLLLAAHNAVACGSLRPAAVLDGLLLPLEDSYARRLAQAGNRNGVEAFARLIAYCLERQPQVRRHALAQLAMPGPSGETFYHLIEQRDDWRVLLSHLESAGLLPSGHPLAEGLWLARILRQESVAGDFHWLPDELLRQKLQDMLDQLLMHNLA